MPTIQLDKIETVINARLDALDRFAGILAHDLGNIILPDTELKSDDPSPELRKCHEKLHDLADHIMTSRQAMDIWRDHPRVRDMPMNIGQWWFEMGRLLGSVFTNHVQLRLDSQTDEQLSVDPGQLTRTLAHVLMAVDIQCETMQLVEVNIVADDARRRRVLLSIEHEYAVPDTLTAPGLDDALLGEGGRVDAFTTSQVVVALGRRASA